MDGVDENLTILTEKSKKTECQLHSSYFFTATLGTSYLESAEMLLNSRLKFSIAAFIRQNLFQKRDAEFTLRRQCGAVDFFQQ